MLEEIGFDDAHEKRQMRDMLQSANDELNRMRSTMCDCYFLD
jgi:hypothetical protein